MDSLKVPAEQCRSMESKRYEKRLKRKKLVMKLFMGFALLSTVMPLLISVFQSLNQ